MSLRISLLGRSIQLFPRHNTGSPSARLQCASLHYSRSLQSTKHGLRDVPPFHAPSKDSPVISSRLQTLATSTKSSDLGPIDEFLAQMPYQFQRTPSPETHTLILRAFLESERHHLATLWLKNMKRKPPFVVPDISQCNMVLAASRLPYQTLRSLVTSMKVTGCEPNVDTYSILIEAACKGSLEDGRSPYNSILFLIEETREEKLPYDPDMDGLLYRGLIGIGGIEQAELARKAYRRACPRDSPKPPNPSIIGSRIHGLLRAPPIAEDTLDNALKLYEDAKQTRIPETPASVEEIAIFRVLLRALSSSLNATKYAATIQSVFADMNSRQISSSSIAALWITEAMQSAPNVESAYRLYKVQASELDEEGYLEVLDTFCRLVFTDSATIASSDLYFRIVQDLRMKGYKTNESMYILLLQQIADAFVRTRSSMTGEALDKLRLITARTHNLINLDACIPGQPPLWNQLMETYQRLLCFGDVCRVWDHMYLSGRYNHASISIIFQACGLHSAGKRAVQIFNRLSQEKFRLNIDNWNSWIECICRLGHLDEAVKQVCLVMGNNEVAPNIQTIRILTTFAGYVNERGAVLHRIQKHHPRLSAQLPQNLKA